MLNNFIKQNKIKKSVIKPVLIKLVQLTQRIFRVAHVILVTYLLNN